MQSRLKEEEKPVGEVGDYPRIPLYDLDTMDDHSLNAEGRASALRAGPLSWRKDLLAEKDVVLVGRAVLYVRRLRRSS
ncbi:MAG: hypothetical protein HY308_14410 [Gammaproteobacteria bacterium]|nr:hypothetical protein [Gammaproteobacteria bacterium]